MSVWGHCPSDKLLYPQMYNFCNFFSWQCWQVNGLKEQWQCLICEQMFLLSQIFSLNRLISERFVHKLSQWSGSSSYIEEKRFSVNNSLCILVCSTQSYSMASEDMDYARWIVWSTFMMLLCHFWSLKALVPIHCNCMEKVTSILFKMSVFVFHIDKKVKWATWHENDYMMTFTFSCEFFRWTNTSW